MWRCRTPFGELLTQLLTARPGVLDQIGSLATDLAALVPTLVDAPSAPVGALDEHARARLFRAVEAAIDTVATEPVVAVLDDMQYADEAR